MGRMMFESDLEAGRGMKVERGTLNRVSGWGHMMN